MTKATRLLLPLFLFALAAGAHAQTTGKITGTVTDAITGEALPGVNVVVEGTSVGTATDFDGQFTIIGVRPGTKALVASFIGYSTQRVEGVRVSVDLTTTVDIEMREEVFEGEEIVVTADAVLVRRDLTSSEFRVTAESIESLPVQEIGDILTAQAGITTSASGIHIRGGRSKEVAYFVDGVRVTDAYDGSVAIQIENDGIQELQVISGTYNAEYGQANSGIINVVTKEPASDFSGSAEFYSGTYAVTGSGAADVLRSENVDQYDVVNDIQYADVDPYSYLEFDPTHYYNVQASLSGPILKDRLGFYTLGRYFKNEGWLYGANIFNPDGSLGDSSLVSMNDFEKFSGQAQLKWQMGRGMFLSLLGLGSYSTGTDLGGRYLGYRQAPGGLPEFEDAGYNVNLQFTHTLSATTFYTLNVANYYKDFQRRLYDDPTDARYVTPFLATAPDSVFSEPNNGGVLIPVITGNGRFNRGGVDLGRFQRSTNSYLVKADVTSQVHSNHLAKLGAEVRFDDLSLLGFDLIPGAVDTVLAIPDVSSRRYAEFDVQPFTVSAYVQDKAEYENFIVNAGLRLDYFDPRAPVPADPEDPNIFNPLKLTNIYRDLDGDGVITEEERVDENRLTIEEREAYWYEDTNPKLQISPRLGVAYPITDKGVIHFSYGHFLQIPTFEFLYNNPGYKIPGAISGTYGPFGNADLEPQRTVMYEIGIQQGFGDHLLLDVTGFYRDVRDWVSTSRPIPAAAAGVDYVIYNNQDYSNVRGLTLALSKRFADGFAFDVDYTFQVAEGSNSNPEEDFFAQQDGAAPRIVLVPLEWDQRHTLNGSVVVGGKTWGASTLARLGSGYPYTPVISASDGGFEIPPPEATNSARRPITFQMDVYAYKDLPVGGFTPRVFLQVYNLLDNRNVTAVFGDTGRADVTRDAQALQGDYDAGYFVRPDFYSEPRRVQLGLQVSF